MAKRFAVIGLGLFGWEVALTLADMGAEVLAIDKDKELVEKIQEHVLFAVQMDSTHPETLATQDLKSVDAAIVGIGSSFEESLLTVVALKQMGVPKVISRAATKLRKEILEQVGCDMVVLPEEEVGQRVAKTLISGLILDRVVVGEHYSIVHIAAPKAFVGEKIIDLKLRETYHVNIVTIKRKIIERNMWGKEVVRERIKAVPSPDDQILQGDIMVLFGHDDDLERLTKAHEES